jgi:hypothetical protein
LRRQFRKEKSDTKQRLSCIEVIGVKTKVVQEVIGISLTDIPTRQIERKEGHSSPCSDSPVKLANYWKLFSPSPALVRVETVEVLILGVWLVECSESLVVEDRRLRSDIIEAKTMIPSFPQSCVGWSNRAGIVFLSFYVCKIARRAISVQ